MFNEVCNLEINSKFKRHLLIKRVIGYPHVDEDTFIL